MHSEICPHAFLVTNPKEGGEFNIVLLAMSSPNGLKNFWNSAGAGLSQEQ